MAPKLLALLLPFLLSLSVSSHALHNTRGANTTGVHTPKLDTHSIIYPGFYRDAVIASGQVPGPDGNSAPPNWTLSAHLQFMKDNNIHKSYLSCSSPRTVLSPAPRTVLSPAPVDLPAGIALTKRFNNYLSTLKRTHPQQFGFFASLPLPSIPDALAEIDRALDDLHADGFVLLSNAYGLYLGDPKLAPVYAKLNARNAVLFIHPTIPCPINTPLSVSGTPRLSYVAPLMNAYQAPTLEFIFDSTRTLSDLILTGTAALCPSIKWLIPHCGSALPSLLDRFITASKILGPKPGSDRKVVSYDIQNVTALLNRNFWFDLAGFPMNNQIYNMRQLLGAGAAGRFTYGSDVPFTPFAAAGGLMGIIEQGLPNLFDAEEIGMVLGGNAEGLLAGRK